MHRVASIAVLALASSVALAEETPADDTATEATEALDVEAILTNPLGEEDYRKTRNCIWSRQIDEVEILDENLVVFRGRMRGQIWLNKLVTACPGLRRDMVPVTNARNGSVCRMSQMGARPRSSLPVELPIRCWLGEFETIDEEQLEALKRAIEESDKAGKASEQTEDG